MAATTVDATKPDDSKKEDNDNLVDMLQGLGLVRMLDLLRLDMGISHSAVTHNNPALGLLVKSESVIQAHEEINSENLKLALDLCLEQISQIEANLSRFQKAYPEYNKKDACNYWFKKVGFNALDILIPMTLVVIGNGYLTPGSPIAGITYSVAWGAVDAILELFNINKGRLSFKDIKNYFYSKGIISKRSFPLNHYFISLLGYFASLGVYSYLDIKAHEAIGCSLDDCSVVDDKPQCTIKSIKDPNDAEHWPAIVVLLFGTMWNVFAKKYAAMIIRYENDSKILSVEEERIAKTMDNIQVILEKIDAIDDSDLKTLAKNAQNIASGMQKILMGLEKVTADKKTPMFFSYENNGGVTRDQPSSSKLDDSKRWHHSIEMPHDNEPDRRDKKISWCNLI